MSDCSKGKIRITLMHLVLLLIFAASMNIVNRYYYFIFFAAIFFCFKPNRRLHFNLASVVALFVLAVSWLAFSPISTISVFGVVKSFVYLLCYVMGMSLLDDDKENRADKTSYKLFYTVIVVIAAGMLLHYVLNWITNAGADDRNTVDFWTKSALAATGQAALACIPLGVALACLFSKTGKRVKIAAAVVLLIILGYNLILSGRTLFLMALIVAAVAFLHKLSQQKRGKAKSILTVAVIIFAVIILYRFNFLGIRSFVESSPFYDRFFAENSSVELNEDGRLEKKIYHLRNMHRFLFGGAHIRQERGYAHDLLLDTYDEAGIFAFIAMIAYVIATVSHLIRCIKNKAIPFVVRQTVLCVYAALYIEFFVEPILQGMPWLFAAFCLIDGYVCRILKQNRLTRNE